MSRYKGRASHKTIEKDYPYAVEMVVPEGGFGRRLDVMYEWHAAKHLKYYAGRGRYEEGRHFICWRFAEADTAADFAATFAFRA